MAGGVNDAHFEIAEADGVVTFVIPIHRRRLFNRESEHHPGPHRVFIKKQVVPVQIDRHIEPALGFRDSRHMIDMAVGEQDVSNLELLGLDERQELLHLVTRIDEHRLLRSFAANHITILEERPNGRTFDNHSIRITGMLPTVTDVYEARRRLGSRIPRTPLLPSHWLSSIADGNVFLKIESLNLTNSFKIRGALNAALRLSEGIDAEATTVVAASAGNHGRSLALAAEELGLPCVIFTPQSAPEAKQNAIRRHGAILHSDCDDYDEAERRARQFADSEGATYISPYNHSDVIAGAGTIGLEIVEAMPSFDVIVVPLGGGGLASGVGLAIKAAAPNATIVGVEVEASSPFTLSLEAGRITAITPRPSLADGLVGNLEPGAMTFTLVKQVVDHVVTVSEDELTRSMKGLATEERLIVEGAGAAAVAAVIAGKTSAPGQRVVALVTGGNVDLPKWLFTIS